MTRVALTKLFILLILAFIICLPEFFTFYRVSKVNFLCLPYRPCERGNPVKTGGNGMIEDAEIKRKKMCDPSQTPEREKWEQGCTQKSQSNKTDPVSDFRGGSEDPEKSWFICETDTNMAELHRNISSSDLKVQFEVSVELQLTVAETLNLTLYGLNNQSSLHLHPLEEEEDEKEEKQMDGVGQSETFYCCLPASPTSESANQSHCLLWLANQTVLNATAKEKLPWKRPQKDEWRCMFRVLWLVLLCVFLLIIVTTVLGQVYWGRSSCKNPKVHPVGYNFTGRQLNDGERHTDTLISRGMIPHSLGSRTWPVLSPIQEVGSQDNIETLLDGNVDQCYTANLHHRSHPSASSLTEEQAW
ncbi:uncharacterized protein [Pagrus major]|uniref:uncharacterized protein n=1 Tax=Pagrus major TaxID=143350 RepID=UPI003CC8BB35